MTICNITVFIDLGNNAEISTKYHKRKNKQGLHRE